MSTSEANPIPELPSPYDPDPPKLRPDPQLGTREGWAWCARCQSIQPPRHKCYR